MLAHNPNMLVNTGIVYRAIRVTQEALVRQMNAARDEWIAAGRPRGRAQAKGMGKNVERFASIGVHARLGKGKAKPKACPADEPSSSSSGSSWQLQLSSQVWPAQQYWQSEQQTWDQPRWGTWSWRQWQ